MSLLRRAAVASRQSQRSGGWTGVREPVRGGGSGVASACVGPAPTRKSPRLPFPLLSTLQLPPAPQLHWVPKVLKDPAMVEADKAKRAKKM